MSACACRYSCTVDRMDLFFYSFHFWDLFYSFFLQFCPCHLYFETKTGHHQTKQHFPLSVCRFAHHYYELVCGCLLVCAKISENSVSNCLDSVWVFYMYSLNTCDSLSGGRNCLCKQADITNKADAECMCVCSVGVLIICWADAVSL